MKFYIMACLCFMIGLEAKSAFINGNELGNGGDAISCDNGQDFFYDAYEAEFRFGMKPQFPQGIDEYEIAKKVVARFEGVSDMRARAYIKWIEEFPEDSQFLDNIELIDIPDTNSGFIPARCHIRQLLIQRTPKFPGEKRFAINNDLWRRLSIEHRAAAIVHEMLLREGRINEHQTSENIRNLNAYLLSGKISQFRIQKNWVSFLQKVIQFKFSDFDGIWIDLIPGQPLEFDELTGMIAIGELYEGVPLIPNQIISIPWVSRASNIGSHPKVKYRNGKVSNIISHFQFESGFNFKGDLEVSSQGVIKGVSFIYKIEGTEVNTNLGLLQINGFGRGRIFAPGIPEELRESCDDSDTTPLFLNRGRISYIKLDSSATVLDVKYCSR